MDSMVRRGRPRDSTTTRARILAAAHARFSHQGYHATAVRQVADDAEVSPNLISRYFGGKEGLFLAAAEPTVAGGDVFTGPLHGFGDRLARSIVTRWSTMPDEDPLLVLLRAAGERRDAAARLSAYLDANSTDRLERWLLEQGVPAPEARDRAEAIDALILGVTMRRRVLREDLGDPDVLQRSLARSLQALAQPEH